MKIPLLLALTSAVMLSASSLGAASSVNVNVNVTVTAEGKKVTRPYRDDLVYYSPVLAGYTEAGLPIAGVTPPSNREVVRLLAKALAGQGYRVFSPTKPPTLQLVFTWGYMNAGKGSLGAQIQMVKLVSGETVPTTDDDPIGTWVKTSEHQQILSEAGDDRYFVMITAYDHDAAVNQNKQILLWEARMSVPMNEVSSLGEVLPTLLNTAAQHFGRKTSPPYRVKTPLIATLDEPAKPAPTAQN